MRKIINSTYATLDGVIQDPQDWPSMGGFSDTGSTGAAASCWTCCDAVLLGRLTYEAFAPVWSAMSVDAVSDRMNALPKYVVSSTLSNPTGQPAVVIDHDPVEAVRELKQQPGADIVQYGFGRLAHEADGCRTSRRAAALGCTRSSSDPARPGDLLYRSGFAGWASSSPAPP